MSHILVALFDTPDDAMVARDRLIADGFDPHEIRLKGAADDASPTGIAHWFRSLLGLRDDDEQTRLHEEAVRRGGTLLTVDTRDTDRVDRAADLLRRCGAVDLERRADQWRSEGWAPGVIGAAAGGGAPPRPGPDQARAPSDAETAGRPPPAIEDPPATEEAAVIGIRLVQRGSVRVFVRDRIGADERDHASAARNPPAEATPPGRRRR